MLHRIAYESGDLAGLSMWLMSTLLIVVYPPSGGVERRSASIVLRIDIYVLPRQQKLGNTCIVSIAKYMDLGDSDTETLTSAAFNYCSKAGCVCCLS